MKTIEEIASTINDTNTNNINEAAIYDDIISKLNEAKEKGIPVEEGLLGGIIGGVAGATIGPAIMKALCNALGVDIKGPFGSLLTSRLILAAVGAKVGW